MKGSVWLAGADGPAFAGLDEDVTADVAVVGGGIVGVTTALLLHEAGARVVLLDAGRVDVQCDGRDANGQTRTMRQMEY